MTTENAPVALEGNAAREELERLEKELADRRSIIHFAHAAVASIFALIVASAAAKLFWDSTGFSWLAVAATVVAVAGAIYALVQYLRGRKLGSEEQRRFESLLSLRHALRLDDPSALLPR